MKRIIYIIALLLALATSAWATDITVSQHTLTNNHGYTGGNIKLRIYFTGCSGGSFLDSNGVMIMCGTVGSNTGFYLELPVTLVGTTLTIPVHTLPSTDDASSTSVRATAVFYTGNTRRDNLYQNYAIPSTLGLTITMAQLVDFNKQVVLPNPPASFLDASATASMIRDSSEAPIVEAPTGAINSSNQTFTISQPIVLDSDEVYLNGVRQKRITVACTAGTETYSISGQTITHCLPPQTGDELLVAYRIAAPLIGPLDPATRLRESSGPTLLAIEAISDGECLRRLGSTIDGITCSGGGGGGLLDPGANGIIKRTALNTTVPAVAGTDYLTPTGVGTGLTALNASNITTGSLSDSVLSANIPRKDTVNAFTAVNSFSANVGIGTTSPDKALEILNAAQSQLRLTHTDTSAYTDFTVNSGGTLTVAPSGSFNFDTTGGQIDPVTNYDQSLGQLSKKYLSLHAAELWVETIVAQNTLATIGGRIITAPTNILTADLAAGATTITVKYNNFLTAGGTSCSGGSPCSTYMEADGKVEFFNVISAAGGSAGAYTYTVTRNLDGSGSDQWYAGDAMVSTTSGFIDQYSVRGVKSGSEIGPTIVGNLRNSATYNDWNPHWAIGNLNGLFGYSSNTVGVALGEYAANRFHSTLDATNGLRFFTGLSTVIGQWSADGNITVGQVAAGQGNIVMSNAGNMAIRNNTTDRIRLNSDGTMLFNDSAGTTKMTFNASAGMTLDGKLQMLGSSSAIAIGTTPPTSASAGTGIWLDRTGMYGLASSVLQAKFSATDGKITAGGGAVVLDSLGISITGGSLSSNKLKFYSGATFIAAVQSDRIGSETFSSLFTETAVAAGYANSSITAMTDGFATLASVFATAYDDTHGGQPSKGHIVLSPSTTGGVIVGPTYAANNSPLPSVIFQIDSTTGAFLPPRMTTAQKNALTATDGMVVYDTDLAKLQVRAGGAWVSLH